MAGVNSLVTHGIGPASSVTLLLTGGLGIGEEASIWTAVSAAGGSWSAVSAEGGTWTAVTPETTVRT